MSRHPKKNVADAAANHPLELCALIEWHMVVGGGTSTDWLLA